MRSSIKRLSAAFAKAGLYHGPEAQAEVANNVLQKTARSPDAPATHAQVPIRLDARYLCQVCSTAWQEAEGVDFDTGKFSAFWLSFKEDLDFPDFSILAVRAMGGCKFCSFLRDVLRSQLPVWFEKSLEQLESGKVMLNWIKCYSLGQEVPAKMLTAELSVHPRDVRDQLPEGFEDEWLRCRIDIDLDDNVAPRTSRDAPNSFNADDVMRGYLEKCVSQHGITCNQRLEKFTPTRLIEVGEGNTLRLVQLGKMQDTTRYATLSYSWGPPRPNVKDYKTIAANVGERCEGFALDEQPATIRDAVAVTRALKIPYLWIDALCIIQGDREEWQREGMQMDKIYDDTFLNIVALQTHSVYESFLHRPIHSFEIQVPGPNQQMRKMKLQHPKIENDMYFLIHSPWAQRGWTLQEASIPRRTLFFAEQYLYLHCSLSHYLEGYEDLGLAMPTPLPNHYSLKEVGGTTTSEDVYNTWYDLLKNYTRRAFTYESDRLIAIAGLQRRISWEFPRDGEVYFGLFKHDIARGLLWNPVNPCEKGMKRVEGVPSWSWGSYPGQVDHKRPWDREEYSVLGSAIRFESCSPAGELTIKGRIRGPESAYDWRGEWRPDTDADHPYGPEYHKYWEVPDGVGVDAEIYLLDVGSFLSGREDYYDISCALVLVRVREGWGCGDHDVYRRVGLLEKGSVVRIAGNGEKVSLVLV